MPDTHDSLLSAKEAARYLNISEHTIRNWIRDKKIKFIRLGRSIKIFKSTLDKMIADGTVSSRNQQEESE